MRRATVSSSRYFSSSNHTKNDPVPVSYDDSGQEINGTVGNEDPPPMEDGMTCMAVVEDGPVLSFACYDEERNEILLESCRVNDDIEKVVERFMHTARPNLVLVGNKILSKPALLELVTKPQNVFDELPQAESGQQVTNGEMSRAQPENLPYRLLKTSAFDVRRCTALILQKLRVASLMRRQNQEQAPGFDDPRRIDRNFPLQGQQSSERNFRPSSYHALAAIIDFDSKPQIQALGALLSYLQSTLFQLEESGYIAINRIVQARSSFYMYINATTLSALHIFATEHHPLIAKGPGNAKEGFSLYSLLDRTQSKGGRQMLKEWMMKPLIDLEAINERQNAVELFMQVQLQTSTGVLLSLLAKVGPIDSILARMHKCVTNPTDFGTLTRTLSAAVSICNTLRNDVLPRLAMSNDPSYPFISSILERCSAVMLTKLSDDIVTTVDIDATNASKANVVIRRGFHHALDEMKDQFEMLEDILEKVGAEIHAQNPDLDLSVVFVPQVGFLVSLDKDAVFAQAVELPQDFSHIFNQDGEAFFKCPQMVQLDKDIGDLDGYIKDMESIIVSELEENLLEAEHVLRESFKALSELDCILAFANCAADFDFVRPKLVDAKENRIHIKDGRHPLQELIAAKDFVPNDTAMSQDERVNVITGPNYSGKSCYLRQVGVLVYMAHLGAFIPCSEATISIVDQICARISAVETCAVPQSSFQLDLTQMAAILLRCTSNSLVLIDEFGKGTSPASGIAILGATIKKLSTIGCKTICTTHFLELFSMNIIRNNKDGIKARRMAIHLPRGDQEDAAPLFKLEDGVASSSAGLICAKKAGVNDKIVERAKNLIMKFRESHPVEPLQECMPIIPKPSQAKADLLRFFLSVDDWEKSSDSEIRALLQKVARIDC